MTVSNDPNIFTQWFRRRWQRWIQRRLPANQRITLSHRSIFILPSRFGLVWIGLVILLYLFGTNYQNNLVIGLSLLLLSIFNTCILYCYRNLAGLTLRSEKPPQVYAGETLSFPCQLSCSHHAHEVIMSYPRQGKHQPVSVSTRVTEVPTTSLVPFLRTLRGQVNPGRLKIESFYPLGLCHAWSHVDLDIDVIVFPHHQQSQIRLNAINSDSDQQTNKQGRQVSGVDEYQGLKQYIRGESLKQVAWKQWAQGRGMLTKEFQQPLGQPIWLTFDSCIASQYEQQISELAWQVDQLHRSKQHYGLQLPQLTIAPDHSEAHRINCLEQLALLPTTGGGGHG